MTTITTTSGLKSLAAEVARNLSVHDWLEFCDHLAYEFNDVIPSPHLIYYLEYKLNIAKSRVESVEHDKRGLIADKAKLQDEINKLQDQLAGD